MIAPAGRLTVIRSLGFAATCAIVVTNMIGQGVFLKARVMTCNVGSAGLMIAAWVVAGLLALCGTFTLAELGAALPESGGMYAFLRRAYGDALAFAFGWEVLFVGGPAATGSLAVGSAIFFDLASGHALSRLSGSFPLLGIPLRLSGLQVAAIALIVVVTAINLAPAIVNGGIATASAALKIGMLAGVTWAAFALSHGSLGNFDASASAATCTGVSAATRGGIAGFAAALIGALYAYQGWHSVTMVAGEVKNPGRVLPTALGASVALVMLGYVAANVAFVYVLGADAIANLMPGASVGVSVVEAVFGPLWRIVSAALLFASIAATLHVTILTNARITYAFGRDHFDFRSLGKLSARARVPANALVANAIISIVLVLLGSFDTLSDYLVFNSWVFFVAAVVAVFVLRRREPHLERPYRTFGYPIVPAVFTLVGTWLLVQTLASNPLNSAIGLAIVALSFPVYFWRRGRQPLDAFTSEAAVDRP